MYLLAIDDLTLSDIGIGTETARPLITDESERLRFAVKRRDTARGTAFFGSVTEPARWNAVIWCPDHPARDAVLAALIGDPASERRLVAERIDTTRTRVAARAVVTDIREPNELDLQVDFESTDSRWTGLHAEQTIKTFATVNDALLRLSVPGNTQTRPWLRIKPVAQRSSFSASAGWRYQRRFRIQNDGPAPMLRHPVRIDLGSSTTNFGGKAQADADDVRVWLAGREQYRSLFGWGTATTYLWVIPPHIPENGGFVDYDIVYGNPSAGAPPTLAYPDLPPFVLDASDNNTWSYPVDDDVAYTGKGAWALLSTTMPATPDYGVPGAWRPARTINNRDNADLTIQRPYYDQGGGVGPMAIFRAGRTDESNTDDSIFEGANDYDGVELFCALPITNVNANFKSNNSAGSGARYVLLNRTTAADAWHVSDNFVLPASGGAATDPGNKALATPSRHVAHALWPNDRWNWSAADIGKSAEVWWDNRLIVTLDDDDLTVTEIQTETEIYEIATEVRVGGGIARVPPYRSLLIGNARQGSGAGTPRAAVPLVNHALVIDPETYRHDVWNLNGSGYYDIVEPLSAHAVRGVVGWRDLDGANQEAESSDWLTLGPARALAPNGGFDADIAGWEGDTVDAGITAARTWDGARGGAQLGSLKHTISANSAGANAIARFRNSALLPLNDRAAVNLGGWFRTDNANLRPYLVAIFYAVDAAGTETFISAERDPGYAWSPPVNTDLTQSFAVRCLEGATHLRIGGWVEAVTAGATGSCWFDDITLDGSDLVVRDESVGQLSVQADLKGAWL